MFNILTVRKQLFNETSLWAQRVQAAGGGFEPNSIQIANNLVRQIKNSSFGPKMVYLLPMLGRGIGAARVPLIDTLNVGAATNSNFVDADFSQAAGLQGNGSNKFLNSLIRASQVGVSNSGGIGWYENNINFGGSGAEVMGAYSNDDQNRYVVDLRATVAFGPWGAPGNGPGLAGSAVNANYYTQRTSSILRQFYKDGTQLGATNTTNDPATGASDKVMYICASNESSTVYWAGRCALAYMTDGTLTDTEVTALDTLLRQYLMSPTGKPQT